MNKEVQAQPLKIDAWGRYIDEIGDVEEVEKKILSTKKRDRTPPNTKERTRNIQVERSMIPHKHDLLYDNSLALLTDFYQLTMSYGYWKAGIDNQKLSSTCSSANVPFKGDSPLPRASKASSITSIDFKFDPSDIEYLASLKGIDDKPFFDEAFFYYLSK